MLGTRYGPVGTRFSDSRDPNRVSKTPLKKTSKIQVMNLWLNSTITSSIWTSPFNLAPFTSLTNCKDFPRFFDLESCRASHLVYKFDKQIARCNNSQIKILNLFEFPHVLAA